MPVLDARSLYQFAKAIGVSAQRFRGGSSISRIQPFASHSFNFDALGEFRGNVPSSNSHTGMESMHSRCSGVIGP
jgi:hypothetical protein